jgi:hypothetical protein
MRIAKFCGSAKSEQLAQASPIDNVIFLLNFANLLKSAMLPLTRVSDFVRTHHIAIDVDHTSSQMGATFHRGRMVTILPEWSRSGMATIVLLPHAAGHELHGPGDFAVALILDKQVNVI